MKKKLLKMLTTGLKLCIICAVSAISLGLLNSVTAPQIDSNRKEQEKLALAELIHRGEPGEKKKVTDETVISYYEVKQGQDIVSYILEITGPGYGGPMKIMAHYAPDGELYGAKLMDNKETPGLGKKAEEPGYMKKFIGKGGAGQNPIPTTPADLISVAGLPGKTDTGSGKQPGREDDISKIMIWIFGKPKTGAEDSVTGATITFKGISKALAAGSEYVKRNF